LWSDLVEQGTASTISLSSIHQAEEQFTLRSPRQTSASRGTMADLSPEENERINLVRSLLDEFNGVPFDDERGAREMISLLSSELTRRSTLQICVNVSVGYLYPEFAARAINSEWFTEYDEKIKADSRNGFSVLPRVKSLCWSAMSKQNRQWGNDDFVPTTQLD
jgi:hypothetical protein